MLCSLRSCTFALLYLAVAPWLHAGSNYAEPVLLSPIATLPQSSAAAVSGNHAVIADPHTNSIIFYSLNNGQWQEVSRFDSDSFEFGIQVAIDGDYALVGGWKQADEFLPARFYKYESGAWQLIQSAVEPGLISGTRPHGSQIILRGNKAVVVSGNYHLSSTLYVYEYNGTQWMVTASLDAQIEGESISDIDFDGETLVVSADFIFDGSNLVAARVYSLHDGALSLQQTLDRIEYPTSDYRQFVAVDGDTLVIGSPADSTNGLGAGALHVFFKTDGQWQQRQTLTEAGGVSGRGFGRLVLLRGDRIVAGHGSIFVLSGQEFIETAYIEPFAELLQYASAQSLDGNYLIVPTGTATDELSRVFYLGDLQVPVERTPHTNLIIETQRVKTVALAPQSGSMLASGANRLLAKDADGIRYFEFKSQMWNSVSFIEPEADISGYLPEISAIPGQSGADPNSVFAIDKDDLIISVEMDEFNVPPNDQLHYYRLTDNGWSLEAVIEEPAFGDFGQEFGLAVDISDGAFAVSGPNVHSGYEEVVYLYEYKDGVVNEVQRIVGQAYDLFGLSLRLQKQHLMISGSGNDRVYFYTKSNGQWIATQTIEKEGYTSSIALDNDLAAVQVVPNNWPDVSDPQRSVDILQFKDGQWSAIGSVQASDRARRDQFGATLEIAGDTVLVGAPGDNDQGNNSGSVYAYQSVDGVWTEVAKLHASDGKTGNRFGSSIVATDDHIVVGNYNLSGPTIYSYDLQAVAGSRILSSDTGNDDGSIDSNGGGQIRIGMILFLLVLHGLRNTARGSFAIGRYKF